LAASPDAVLCHDDFHQGNVLATEDAAGGLRFSGRIDFGNAGAGDALFDLAKALLYSGQEDPRSCKPPVAGYAETDPDPAEAICDSVELVRPPRRQSRVEWTRKIVARPRRNEPIAASM
jgi:Ser/Thr protein kinase RdoA (MazF antagonist)